MGNRAYDWAFDRVPSSFFTARDIQRYDVEIVTGELLSTRQPGTKSEIDP